MSTAAAAHHGAPGQHNAADERHAALVEEVVRIRGLLETAIGGAAAEGAAAAAAGLSVARRPVDSPLAELARAFALSDFERDVVALLAAAELDGEVAALVARDGGPTFALALAALPGGHWDAVAPSSPLRWWRLVSLDAGTPLGGRRLHIDEHVLHHLAGVAAIDDRLAGVVRLAVTGVDDGDGSTPPRDAGDGSTPSQDAVVDDLHATIRGLDEPLVAVLDGGDAEGRRGAACRLARRLGLVPLRVGAAALPAPGPELADIARLIDRELVLLRGLAIVEAAPGSEAIVDELVGLLAAPVVLLSGGELSMNGNRVTVRRTVPWPTPTEAIELWRRGLGLLGDSTSIRRGDDLEQAEPPHGGDDLAAAVVEVAEHYRLGAASVASIGRELRAQRGGATGRDLHQLCRRRCRVSLDGLAERIETAASWDDLVLPAGQAEVLHDIARHVRHRHRVHEEWGFGGPGRRGLGVTALFSGESGTGKTLAAEVLAADLELDLYRIDLSATVSKYIGETEKNLQRLFDAAETSGAVLLFDEADALFGKRGEVRQAHDRYANLEVAYLLGRMETYRGLALLTTNLRANVDRAFLRRLRFVVPFPFPDDGQRARIWARMFPPGAPTKGLDPARLARLAVAGGSIRAIALSAAFAAADEGTPITPAHIERAAEVEYAKADRTLTDGERAALR